MDGWGIGAGDSSDGIHLANTPVMDQLMREQPICRLKTFGEHVGLPEGQMGNSEVGHLNIGAGRVVYQDLARINKSVESGDLCQNMVLNQALKYAKTHPSASIHLMGLLGEGGVHASQSHLHALVGCIESACKNDVFIHAFTDGRDTDPKHGRSDLKRLLESLSSRRAKLASVVGRYYAMDRDLRWERIKKAYDLLVHGIGTPTSDALEALEESYNNGITDEFIEPLVIQDVDGRIRENDVVICFNFRTDRCRQITRALSQESIEKYDMTPLSLHYLTMCRYDESFKNVHVMFEKENLKNTLGEVIAANGLSQLRMAETEKYPHVTFFFSGGREEPFEREQRQVIPSPKVPTYDLQPAMSAPELTSACIRQLQALQPDFLCLNYANPDMVGHTGVASAIVEAVETVDQCLGRLLLQLSKSDYEVIIIADHGNADKMMNEDGSPNTAHTTNLVPMVYKGSRDDVRLKDGILGDVAPTLLQLMGLESPKEMTGRALFD